MVLRVPSAKFAELESEENVGSIFHISQPGNLDTQYFLSSELIYQRTNGRKHRLKIASFRILLCSEQSPLMCFLRFGTKQYTEGLIHL